MTIEIRYSRSEKPAMKNGKLSGRAAAFNKTTQIGGDKFGFREKISPGAFKKSVKERDIVLLDSHNSEKPLARTSAGNLSLRETKDGLDWDANPPETSYANDVRLNADAGNYGGCSFGFEVVRDSWKRGENGDLDERTLEEVKLHEISIVAFPAYGDGVTSVSARDQVKAAQESRERALGPDAQRDTEGAEMPAERGGDAPGNGKKPYGNVTYADPKNGKYPVDTAAHAKAAWSYINKPANASKYPLNGVSLASVKSKIKAACKKFGIQLSESDAAPEPEELREMVAELLTYEFRETSIGVQERETLEAVLEYLSRGDDDAADEYDDDFYERDAADGDPVKPKNKNGSGKSDASKGDKGKADNNCHTCDGSGKDKSGNNCTACGGSGNKNGDGKMHDQGKNEEDDKGKNPGKNQQNSEDDSDVENRSAENGEPDDSTRDEDRQIALRKMRARMMRDQIEAAK